MIVIAFIGQKPYGEAVSCICTTLWNIWHFAGGFLRPHAKHCQPLGLHVYARVYAYVYCTVDKQYPELWNVRILAYNSCLSGMRNATWHSSLSLITAWHAPTRGMRYTGGPRMPVAYFDTVVIQTTYQNCRAVEIHICLFTTQVDI